MKSDLQNVRLNLAVLIEGWQGVLLVACTYIYFLIYAQFGFLKRLAEFGIVGDGMKPVMVAMALGGIAASLICPLLPFIKCPRCRLQGAFMGCALAAELSLFNLTVTTALLIALLIGLSLGLLTTTLVANLPRWTGWNFPLWKVGVGTGIGYFVCNIPALFNATPVQIAYVTIGAAALGTACGFRKPTEPPNIIEPAIAEKNFPFGIVLVWFTAMVWLDSAAFFIIQNSPALKAGTWQGELHLWRNGVLHFAAAILSVFILHGRGVGSVLTLALVALGAACFMLQNPAHLELASFFYPVGVSLYSVALVAFPSLLMQATSEGQRLRRSGYLYALAGWAGSALGIGMAQNLHKVPRTFLLAAGLLFLVPWLIKQKRTLQIQGFAILAVFLIALGLNQLQKSTTSSQPLSAAERGRQIYINEGCINCHSQYVRPNSTDDSMWGPASRLESVQSEQPPLIGNRRQGPDLSDVGTRRSTIWLRLHFINPRIVSYHSPMPSYGYLFKDHRGEDLIAYMQNLRAPDGAAYQRALEESWQPRVDSTVNSSKNRDAAELFQHLCSTCHDAGGNARYEPGFLKLPPDLTTVKFQHIHENNGTTVQVQLARIIKYGIPDSSMAGHEYLSDDQIALLADYVISRHISVDAKDRQ